MGTTTGVGFVPTPTQVEEYTHRLTGNKTGTVYTHTHTHTLDVRSRQPPEPTGSTPEETNRGSGAACYNWGPLRESLFKDQTLRPWPRRAPFDSRISFGKS